METQELKQALDSFSGTEAYHKLSIAPIKCTDGIAWMAQNAKAFWLVDAIGSYQGDNRIKDLRMQFWHLKVEGKKGILWCEEDMNMPHLIEQKFSYTDFPEGDWIFYVVEDVLLLPAEY